MCLCYFMCVSECASLSHVLELLVGKKMILLLFFWENEAWGKGFQRFFFLRCVEISLTFCLIQSIKFHFFFFIQFGCCCYEINGTKQNAQKRWKEREIEKEHMLFENSTYFCYNVAFHIVRSQFFGNRTLGKFDGAHTCHLCLICDSNDGIAFNLLTITFVLGRCFVTNSFRVRVCYKRERVYRCSYIWVSKCIWIFVQALAINDNVDPIKIATKQKITQLKLIRFWNGYT